MILALPLLLMLQQSGEVAQPCPASPANSVPLPKSATFKEAKILSQPVMPQFTSEASQAGLTTSKLALLVTLSETGKICEIRVVSPLGLGLDESAIRAVRHWKFSPATIDGKPVKSEFALQITLTSQDEKISTAEKDRTNYNLALDQLKLRDPVKTAESIKTIEELSERMYPAADGFLALLLIEGKLLPRDPTRALLLASRAEKNSPLAIYALSLLHRSGDGVPQDDAKALKYAKEASTAGVVLAQIWLGQKYMAEGKPGDAKRYFKLCAAQQNKTCQRALAALNSKR